MTNGPTRRDLLWAGGAVGALGHIHHGGGGSVPTPGPTPAPPPPSGPEAPSLSLLAVSPWTASVRATVNGTPAQPVTFLYEISVDGQATWKQHLGDWIYAEEVILKGCCNAPNGVAIRVTMMDGLGNVTQPSNVLTPAIPKYYDQPQYPTGSTRGDRIILKTMPSRTSIGPAGAATDADASGTVLAQIVNGTRFTTGTITYQVTMGDNSNGNSNSGTGSPTPIITPLTINASNQLVLNGAITGANFGRNGYAITLFQNGVAMHQEKIALLVYSSTATLTPAWTADPVHWWSGAPPTTFSIPDNWSVGVPLFVFQTDLSPLFGAAFAPPSASDNLALGDLYRVEVFDGAGNAVDLIDVDFIGWAQAALYLRHPPSVGTYTVKVWACPSASQNANPPKQINAGLVKPSASTTTLHVLPHAGSVQCTFVSGIHNGFPGGANLGTLSVTGLGGTPSVWLVPDLTCLSYATRLSLASFSGTSVQLNQNVRSNLDANWAVNLTAGIVTFYVIASNGTNAVAQRFDMQVGWTALDTFFVGNTRTANNTTVFKRIDSLMGFLQPRFNTTFPGAGSGTPMRGARVLIDPYSGLNPALEYNNQVLSAYDIWGTRGLKTPPWYAPSSDPFYGTMDGTWVCPIKIVATAGPGSNTPAPLATAPVLISCPQNYFNGGGNNGQCLMGNAGDIVIEGGIAFDRIYANNPSNEAIGIVKPAGNTSSAQHGEGNQLINNVSATNYNADFQVGGLYSADMVMSRFHMSDGGAPGFTMYNTYIDKFETVTFGNSNSIRSQGHGLKTRSRFNLVSRGMVFGDQLAMQGQWISMALGGARWELVDSTLQDGPNGNPQGIIRTETLARCASDAMVYNRVTFVNDIWLAGGLGSNGCIDDITWSGMATIPSYDFTAVSWWCPSSNAEFIRAIGRFGPASRTNNVLPGISGYGTAINYDVTLLNPSFGSLVGRPSVQPSQVTSFAVPAPVASDNNNYNQTVQQMFITNWNTAVCDSYQSWGGNLRLLSSVPTGTVIAQCTIAPQFIQLTLAADAAVGATALTIAQGIQYGVTSAKLLGGGISWLVKGPAAVGNGTSTGWINGIQASTTGTWAFVSGGTGTLTLNRPLSAAMAKGCPIYCSRPAGDITFFTDATQIVGGRGIWISVNSTTGNISVVNDGVNNVVPSPNSSGGFICYYSSASQGYTVPHSTTDTYGGKILLTGAASL